MNISPETYVGTRQAPLNYGSHPDLGIFGRNFYHCNILAFCKLIRSAHRAHHAASDGLMMMMMMMVVVVVVRWWWWL